MAKDDPFASQFADAIATTAQQLNPHLHAESLATLERKRPLVIRADLAPGVQGGFWTRQGRCFMDHYPVRGREEVYASITLRLPRTFKSERIAVIQAGGAAALLVSWAADVAIRAVIVAAADPLVRSGSGSMSIDEAAESLRSARKAQRVLAAVGQQKRFAPELSDVAPRLAVALDDKLNRWTPPWLAEIADEPIGEQP